jgi:acetyl-CoA carboxylase carboxyl transferase subunit beta
MDAEARVTMMMDADCEQERHDTHIHSVDALGFRDSKTYPDRIRAADKKTGRNDAFLSVSGTIESIPVELGVMDFAYMGGSMGSVVGEMLTRLYERALERKRPAIVVCASGGARMQEGVLSLMQMAKTSAALARLQNVGRMPYISILTHPTTGGVAASFAMLGDVIVAEPKALIGFAGARVIEQTIGQQLPAGFQTAEYLLDTGMVDRIVPRDELRASVAKILRLLLNQPSPGPVEVETEEA